MSDSNQPIERPSKTQRKQEMLELQKLGETLLALSETELAKVPLEENIKEAIMVARSIKSHEAKRRQLQYIGRLMRNIDPKPIQDALKKIAKGVYSKK